MTRHLVRPETGRQPEHVVVERGAERAVAPAPRRPARPVRGPGPGPAPRARRGGSMLALKVLVVVLLVFQRFVVPGTPIAVALPVAFVVCGLMLVRGHLRADPRHVGLYALAVLGCGSAALLSEMVSGRPMSLESLLLLAVLYLPLCLRAAGPLRARLPELLRFFQGLMVPVALVCVGQWVAQLAGWRFTDLLSWVPSSLLATPTAFNLSYPLYYGSSLFKSNGIVFLEASFASQFLALAILVQILLGRSVWRIALFACALLTTFAGTGILLLGIGLVAIAVRRGGRWTARAAIAAAVAVVAVALSPAGPLLADRIDEPGAQGSSGNARFVAPYELVGAALSENPTELLIGRGPGSVDRDTAFFNPLRVEVSYPVLPKLAAEYGLPAALGFLAFVGAVLVRRAPSAVLSVASVAMYLVLSSALLQPPVVLLVWLLTGLFAHDPPRTARPTLTVSRPFVPVRR